MCDISLAEVDDAGLAGLPAWYDLRQICKHCGREDFQDTFGPRTLVCCEAGCGLATHVACEETHSHLQLDEATVEAATYVWFCSKECQKVAAELQPAVGSRRALGKDTPQFSLELVKYDMGNKDSTKVVDQAIKILKEAFGSCIFDNGLELADMLCTSYETPDSETKAAAGEGSVDFSAFRVLVLRLGTTIVTAASLRAFGTKFAELPLIATRMTYRRAGHCRRLIQAVEGLLKRSGVRYLVLPAIKSLVGMWRTKFGFVPLTPEEMEGLGDSIVCPDPESVTLLKKDVIQPPPAAAPRAKASKKRPRGDAASGPKPGSKKAKSASTTRGSHASDKPLTRPRKAALAAVSKAAATSKPAGSDSSSSSSSASSSAGGGSSSGEESDEVSMDAEDFATGAGSVRVKDMPRKRPGHTFQLKGGSRTPAGTAAPDANCASPSAGSSPVSAPRALEPAAATAATDLVAAAAPEPTTRPAPKRRKVAATAAVAARTAASGPSAQSNGAPPGTAPAAAQAAAAAAPPAKRRPPRPPASKAAGAAVAGDPGGPSAGRVAGSGAPRPRGQAGGAAAAAAGAAAPPAAVAASRPNADARARMYAAMDAKWRQETGTLLCRIVKGAADAAAAAVWQQREAQQAAAIRLHQQAVAANLQRLHPSFNSAAEAAAASKLVATAGPPPPGGDVWAWAMQQVTGSGATRQPLPSAPPRPASDAQAATAAVLAAMEPDQDAWDWAEEDAHGGCCPSSPAPTGGDVRIADLPAAPRASDAKQPSESRPSMAAAGLSGGTQETSSIASVTPAAAVRLTNHSSLHGHQNRPDHEQPRQQPVSPVCQVADQAVTKPTRVDPLVSGKQPGRDPLSPRRPAEKQHGCGTTSTDSGSVAAAQHAAHEHSQPPRVTAVLPSDACLPGNKHASMLAAEAAMDAAATAPTPATAATSLPASAAAAAGVVATAVMEAAVVAISDATPEWAAAEDRHVTDTLCACAHQAAAAAAWPRPPAIRTEGLAVAASDVQAVDAGLRCSRSPSHSHAFLPQQLQPQPVAKCHAAAVSPQLPAVLGNDILGTHASDIGDARHANTSAADALDGGRIAITGNVEPSNLASDEADLEDVRFGGTVPAARQAHVAGYVVGVEDAVPTRTQDADVRDMLQPTIVRDAAHSDDICALSAPRGDEPLQHDHLQSSTDGHPGVLLPDLPVPALRAPPPSPPTPLAVLAQCFVAARLSADASGHASGSSSGGPCATAAQADLVAQGAAVPAGVADAARPIMRDSSPRNSGHHDHSDTAATEAAGGAQHCIQQQQHHHQHQQQLGGQESDEAHRPVDLTGRPATADTCPCTAAPPAAITAESVTSPPEQSTAGTGRATAETVPPIAPAPAVVASAATAAQASASAVAAPASAVAPTASVPLTIPTASTVPAAAAAPAIGVAKASPAYGAVLTASAAAVASTAFASAVAPVPLAEPKATTTSAATAAPASAAALAAPVSAVAAVATVPLVRSMTSLASAATAAPGTAVAVATPASAVASASPVPLAGPTSPAVASAAAITASAATAAPATAPKSPVKAPALSALAPSKNQAAPARPATPLAVAGLMASTAPTVTMAPVASAAPAPAKAWAPTAPATSADASSPARPAAPVTACTAGVPDADDQGQPRQQQQLSELSAPPVRHVSEPSVLPACPSSSAISAVPFLLQSLGTSLEVGVTASRTVSPAHSPPHISRLLLDIPKTPGHPAAAPAAHPVATAATATAAAAASDAFVVLPPAAASAVSGPSSFTSPTRLLSFERGCLNRLMPQSLDQLFVDSPSQGCALRPNAQPDSMPPSPETTSHARPRPLPRLPPSLACALRPDAQPVSMPPSPETTSGARPRPLPRLQPSLGCVLQPDAQPDSTPASPESTSGAGPQPLPWLPPSQGCALQPNAQPDSMPPSPETTGDAGRRPLPRPNGQHDAAAQLVGRPGDTAPAAFAAHSRAVPAPPATWGTVATAEPSPPPATLACDATAAAPCEANRSATAPASPSRGRSVATTDPPPAPAAPQSSNVSAGATARPGPRWVPVSSPRATASPRVSPQLPAAAPAAAAQPFQDLQQVNHGARPPRSTGFTECLMALPQVNAPRPLDSFFVARRSVTPPPATARPLLKPAAQRQLPSPPQRSPPLGRQEQGLLQRSSHPPASLLLPTKAAAAATGSVLRASARPSTAAVSGHRASHHEPRHEVSSPGGGVGRDAWDRDPGAQQQRVPLQAESGGVGCRVNPFIKALEDDDTMGDTEDLEKWLKDFDTDDGGRNDLPRHHSGGSSSAGDTANSGAGAAAAPALAGLTAGAAAVRRRLGAPRSSNTSVKPSTQPAAGGALPSESLACRMFGAASLPSSSGHGFDDEDDGAELLALPAEASGGVVAAGAKVGRLPRDARPSVLGGLRSPGGLRRPTSSLMHARTVGERSSGVVADNGRFSARDMGDFRHSGSGHNSLLAPRSPSAASPARLADGRRSGAPVLLGSGRLSGGSAASGGNAADHDRAVGEAMSVAARFSSGMTTSE